MSTQSAQSIPSTPSMCTQEVRLAVVMYGGVSLAIYINGVAQELLRLVRATAPIGAGGAPLPGSELNDSEKVYRKLSVLLADLAKGNAPGYAQPFHLSVVPNEAPTRFVIDTISGSSAGGINGVFLAKALANGQNLDELRRLWVREGAIEKLINDASSEDPPLSVVDPPTALLNGQRMYFELLKAFEGMESKSPSSRDSKSSAKPLVKELDLFVTTTDLRGITLPLRLADEVVFERRHKNVFRFVYSSGEDARNDFIAKNNPFLAFASRCTSSFPFAFEPMALNDIDSVLDVHELLGGENQKLASNSDEWKRFFRTYSDAKGARTVPIPRRSFADGGDLDNKPFSYVIDTLARRHAEVPVQRKLIYIEPSPEHPEDEVELDRKPNFIENVLDALTSLPRYETIREDLQRIVDRNRVIERLNRVVYDVEEDERRAKQSHDVGVLKLESINRALWAKEVLSDTEWASLDLTDMIRRKGRAYLAYHRMEIAALTDDLAKLIARVAGLDEDSDYFLVIRALVRAWRDEAFTSHKDHRRGRDHRRRTLNAFLNSYDLSYSLRRISFLQRKADFLSRLDEKALAVLERQEQTPWRAEEGPSQEQAAELRDELLRIKSELKRQHDELRKLGRKLRSRYRPEQIASSAGDGSKVTVSPLRKLVDDLIETLNKRVNIETGNTSDKADLLQYFLGPDRRAGDQNKLNYEDKTQSETVEDQAVKRASKLWGLGRRSVAGETEEVDLWASFVRLAEELETQIDRKTEINEKCLEALGKQSETRKNEKPKFDDSPTRAVARDCLRYYFEHYDDFDMITFPFLFDTDIGEAAIVEVFRISPEDAKLLIDERSASISRCQKLAGTSLGHFGAFLERRWRENDMLWGRLDGAERLITALLPPNHPSKRALIGEAQAAIVLETIREMGREELQDLLCESSMRTSSKQAEADILTNFIKQLKENAGESNDKLLPLLQDQVIRQHYLNIYDERSRLNAEATLRTAARATTVVGKMFQDLAEQYKVSGKSFALVARCGQVFWGLVEVSVPRTIPQLVFRYWLKLLYLLELLLIICSTILINSDIQKFAFLLFGLTVSIHFAVWVLENEITSSRRWVKVLKALGVTLFGILLIAGALGLAGTFGLDAIWRGMTKVHGWLTTSNAIGKLSARVAVAASFTVFFLWIIRHDLRAWWRSLFSPDNLIPHNFEPIAIQPLTPLARKRITKSRRFLFLPGRKVIIPFRLSAEPSKEWLESFKKNCETQHAGEIRISGRELQLKCEPQNLKERFEALKAAIIRANNEMSEEFKRQLLEKTRPKDTPEPQKSQLESSLNELDYTV